MSLPTKKFYSIFWSNEACRNIFLNHKDHILQKEIIQFQNVRKVIHFQRLVLSNSLKRAIKNSHLSQRIENKNIELSDSLEKTVTKNFNEEKFEKYINEKFGNSIKKISDKLDGGKIAQIKFFSEFVSSLVSEKRFIKFLKNYLLVPEQINTLEDIGIHIEKFFEAEMKTIITPEKITDILTSLDDISAGYNNQVYLSLLEANKLFTDIFYDQDNFEDRILLFDMLYDSGVIYSDKYQTYYECTHCDDGVFKGIVSLKVKPSKIKLKCPNCNKEVFYLAPYKIHDGIYDHIKDKDGLIFHGIQYLLKDKKIKFIPNVKYPPDVELDICIINDQTQVTQVIETKMYKLDRPIETQVSNLTEDIKKFSNAIDKLISIDQNFKFIDYIFITNYKDEKIYSSTKQEILDIVKDKKIKLMSVNDFNKSLYHL